jgi:hypothetical protein
MGEHSERTDRRRFSAEMITALSAVLIGLSAVAVSIYETTLIRQQQKGSAWPHVEVGFSYNNDGFRYALLNTGVGPARIIHAIVRVDGEPVPDWKAFFEQLEMPVNRYMTSQMARRVVGAQGVVDALMLGPDEDIDTLYRAQGRVSIEICYCSVYDDCWKKTIVDEAVEVAGCATDEQVLFVN